MTLPWTRAVLAVAWLGLSLSSAGAQTRLSQGRFDSMVFVQTQGSTLTLAVATSSAVRHITLGGVDDVEQVQLSASGTKAVVLTKSRRLFAFDLSVDNPFMSAYARWPLPEAPQRKPTASHSLGDARFAFVVDGSLIVVDEGLTAIEQPSGPQDVLAAAMRGSNCLLTLSTDGAATVRVLNTGEVRDEGRLELWRQRRTVATTRGPELRSEST